MKKLKWEQLITRSRHERFLKYGEREFLTQKHEIYPCFYIREKINGGFGDVKSVIFHGGTYQDFYPFTRNFKEMIEHGYL